MEFYKYLSFIAFRAFSNFDKFVNTVTNTSPSHSNLNDFLLRNKNKNYIDVIN